MLTKNITAVALNIDRGEIVIANGDLSLQFWNIEAGTVVNNVPKAHEGEITTLTYLRDQKIIVSGGMDSTLNVWNTNAIHQQSIKTDGPVYQASFSPSKSCLAVGQPLGVSLYKVHTTDDGISGGDKAIEPVPMDNFCHTDLVKCVVCFENRCVSGGFDKRIVIHQLPSSARSTLAVTALMQNDANNDDTKFKSLKKIPNAHNGGITALAFIPKTDSVYILSAAYDLSLKLWTMDGQNIARWGGYTTSIMSLDYLPLLDATMLTDGGGLVTFINSRTGEDVTNIVGNLFPSNCNVRFTRAVPFTDIVNAAAGIGVATVTSSSSATMSGGMNRFERMGLITVVTKRNVLLCSTNSSASCSSVKVEGFMNCLACRGDDVVITGGNTLHQWEVSVENPNKMRSSVIEDQTSKELINSVNKASFSNALSGDRDEEEYKKMVLLPSTFSTNKALRQKRQVYLHKKVVDDLRRWESRWSDYDGISWQIKERKQLALMEQDTRKNYEQNQRRMNAKKDASSAVQSQRDDRFKQAMEQAERAEAKKNARSHPNGSQDSVEDDANGIQLKQDPKEVLCCQYVDLFDYVLVGCVSGDLKIFADETPDSNAKKPYRADDDSDSEDDDGGHREHKSIVSMSWAVKLECKHQSAVVALHCFTFKRTTWIASTGYDGMLLIWNLSKLIKHKDEQELAKNARPKTSLSGASKPTTAASGRSTAHGVKEESGKEYEDFLREFAPKQVQIAEGPIRRISYNQETGYLHCVSDDGNAYLMHFHKDGTVGHITALKHEHSVVSMLWFQSRHIDVSGVEDRNLAIMALNPFKQARGMWLTIDSGKTMKVWAKDGKTCMFTFTLPHEPSSAILDDENGLVLIGFQTGAMMLYKLNLDILGERDQIFTNPNAKIIPIVKLSPVSEFKGHTTSICGLERLDSRYASISQDGTLRLWNSIKSNIHEQQHKLKYAKSTSTSTTLKSGPEISSSDRSMSSVESSQPAIEQRESSAGNSPSLERRQM